MIFSNKLVKTCQVILYPLFYLPFRLFYKKRIIICCEFKKNERYIFAANHPSKIDPFLMFYLLPLKEFFKIVPIRFVTKEKLMNNLLKEFFLSLIGCYKKDKEVLKRSIHFIKNKNNLCLFIQGKVTKSYKTKPKVGAIYIHKKVKKSFIIPVKITYKKGKIKKLVEVIFKEKLKYKKFPQDLQILADDLLKIIKK